MPYSIPQSSVSPLRKLPLDVSLLGDAVFLLTAASFAVATGCVNDTRAHLPAFCRELGRSKDDAAAVMMINNVAAFVAAPFFGFVSSMPAVRRRIPLVPIGVACVSALLDVAVAFVPASFGTTIRDDRFQRMKNKAD